MHDGALRILVNLQEIFQVLHTDADGLDLVNKLFGFVVILITAVVTFICGVT